jgi:H+/gluconate symporter-like permease
LVFVGVTTSAAAAAAASSAGGMGVAMEAFSGTYLSMAAGNAATVGMMHRVATIAASTLDTLPHTGGQITLLQICHQTHKDSFSHIFITQAVIPIIGLVGLIAWHMAGL